MYKEIRFVDAFTEYPFGGNPAAVVLEASGLSDGMMQKVAREMTVSETAFVRPDPTRKAKYEVRFFTPHTEVNLCGHATVATFWTLASAGYIKRRAKTIASSQRTRAGILPVEMYYDGETLTRVMMEQARPKFRKAAVEPRQIARILGIRAAHITKSGLPLALVSTGLWSLKVPVTGRKVLESIRLDRHSLAELGHSLKFETCCVFCFDTVDKENFVHQRVFCPQVGIEEDPATGTASGSLGAYLARHGVIDPGPDGYKFAIEQGHLLGRPGHIYVEVYKEHGKLFVMVGGAAVEVLKGLILCRD